ncbi:hypothetical protein FN846DRAFT_976473 [Sphaerosporella brunnea]|uniref:Uncharacterized protein n=1 Tax=Sphaerosporella brunnea TaxID=1250544 RepID=A0A5J5EGA5_9PEZI|nr:hypothetical protein FN846DRAFT_976473 [Sphaerosporella brunnea]
MQFKLVSLALAALVASAAAQNGTNGTNGTYPSASPSSVPDSAAFQNAVSGGLLGAAIAGVAALVL